MVKIEFSSEELTSAECEWTSLLASCDDTALMRLCETRSKDVLPNLSIAAEAVAAQIESAARDHVPLSLIRAGDGEGNALYLREANSFDSLALKCFNFIFKGQTGTSLGFDDAKALCGRIGAALLDADIAGFRVFDCSFRQDELSDIDGLMKRGDIRCALGMMGARRFLESKPRMGRFSIRL